MNENNISKKFYSDKTIDELQFNLTFYKSRLEILMEELEFFTHLMKAKIYNQKIPNVFETFELFKNRMDVITKLHSKLLEEIDRQYNEVKHKLECDDLSCDLYFVRCNYELELDVVNFLMDTNKLKSEMMEYLKGIIS